MKKRETPLLKLKSTTGSYPNICFHCPSLCCIDANPPLTNHRKEKIVKFLRNGMNNETDFIIDHEYCHPKQKDKGYCVFLDIEARKCMIHPKRPETCRAGPITFDIDLEHGKIEWYLKEETICSLAGWLAKNPKELQKQLNLAKLELTKLINNLPVQHLAAILQIDEPETYLIGEDDLNSRILHRLRNYYSASHKTI